MIVVKLFWFLQWVWIGIVLGLAAFNPSGWRGGRDADSHNIAVSALALVAIVAGWGMCHALDRIASEERK